MIVARGRVWRPLSPLLEKERDAGIDRLIATADAAIAQEHGKPSRDTVAARNAKATAMFKAGRVRDAKAVWDEALALAPTAMGTEHPNYAAILAGSANADLALGDLQGARCKRLLGA